MRHNKAPFPGPRDASLAGLALFGISNSKHEDDAVFLFFRFSSSHGQSFGNWNNWLA